MFGARPTVVWLLPFDPNAAIQGLVREEYARRTTSISLARRAYYRLRPLLPRSVQIAARRRFVRVQERAVFPSWPAEAALDDLQRFLLALVEQVASAPLPWIALWPDSYAWAAVLTHDVESAAGYAHTETVSALERSAGVRSAWYFVPERDYLVEPGRVRALADAGFEVGVHGLKHDGRDLTLANSSGACL